MAVRSVLLKAALALVALGMLTAAAPANAATTIKGYLAGPAIENAVPTGYYTYTSDTSYKTLKISIYRVKLAASTVLTARVGSTVVGTLKIKVKGAGATLSLDTRAGHTVPVMTAASVVTVKKADGTLVLTGPQTAARDWSMRTTMSGAKIDGKKPAGTVTYSESDYTYTRKLRVLAFSVNLAGKTLKLYLNSNLLGSCVVSSSKVCTIQETLLDSESVQHLTTSSVLKLKRADNDAVVLTTGAWK